MSLSCGCYNKEKMQFGAQRKYKAFVNVVYCVWVWVGISTCTTHTYTDKNTPAYTCTFANIQTDLMHTLSVQRWQVLVLNLVVLSASLISGAADGGRWGPWCVSIRDEGSRQKACHMKACCFVGKAKWRECIWKCEVMGRMLNPLRQNINKC